MAEMRFDEQAVFEIARQITSSETRRSYLEQVCAGDSALHQRVTDLLRAYEESDTFLESPPPGLDEDLPASGGSAADPPAFEGPGSVIGPYKLLEQIAEGGMGIVYMAEQLEPVERRVALKIIKPGMDTRHVIARFQAEWQALAMMDHPNIAKIHDAGTTGPDSGCPGRPYFVMELVKGVPITTYCDQRRLRPQQRMELFIQVCQAVQHAHQKGIIHRDLKPSNILVAQYDDRPIPKIIDFGVAKAIGQRLTEKTVFTHFGQIIGTVEYMSPEQAQFNQLDIDTRSDVYSLGVILYELLSGLTPFDGEELRSAAFDEMLRMVREQEPLRPSARLRTSDKLPAIAANRQIDPEKLGSLVRGELDWIVMKALEKDRTRRYESASSLAADVQNYLNNEPVKACPPSAAYRFRKFARRHKAALFTTLVAVAASLLGTAAITWQAIRATRESAAKAAALVEKDAALAMARKAVDQMLVRVGSDKLQSVPLAHPLRQSLLNDALQFYKALLLQIKGDPTLHEETADVLNALGGIQRELGQYESAARSFEDEIELLQNLVITHPNVAELMEKQAASEEDLAYTWQVTPPSSNGEQVDAHYRAALAIYAELERRWPDRPQPVALCLRHLAEQASARGEHTQAEERWREAIERGERYLEREPSDAVARSQLCWACVDLWESMNASPKNRLPEMEEVIQTGVGHAAVLLEQDPRAAYVRDVAASLNLRLAVVCCRRGRVAEGLSRFQDACRELESLCADFPWNQQYWITTRYAQNEAVRSLEAAGRREDAKSIVHQSYEWVQKLANRVPDELPPQAEVLQCQTQLANSLHSLGFDRQASELAQIALALHSELEKRAANVQEGSAVVVRTRLSLPVELLPAADAVIAAREKLRPALEDLKSDPKAFAAAAHALVERAYRARENWQLTAALALATAVADAARNSPLLVESRIEGLDEVMHCQWRLGQLDEAEATGREVLALAHQQAARHWAETSIYARLAEISLARGRFDEAESWARKSVAMIDQVGLRNASPQFIHLLLARALRGQGKLPDALTALERAWKQSDAMNMRTDSSLAFYEWLATARTAEDPQLMHHVAHAALDTLNSRDQTSLDGLHFAWRAMTHCELNGSEVAARDWELAFERGIGDAKALSFLATARLHRGDLPGYRHTCAQSIKTLAATDDENACFRLAWMCAVGPQALDDLSVPLGLATRILEKNPGSAAYLCTTGAILYRMGRYDQAADRLRESIDAFAGDQSDQLSAQYPKLLLAMTQWQLGLKPESRKLLAEVRSEYDHAINSARHWSRRATLECLCQEARDLITSDLTQKEANE